MVEFEIRLLRRGDQRCSADAIRRHVARLAALDEQGRLVAAGPLADGSGGLILARFDSRVETERWAQTDPFVTDGAETVEVRPWEWAHRGNGYLADPADARVSPSTERRFVPLSLDKHDWHPSPLPGQIVVVTTVDSCGEPDLAAKSWVSMAAFSGPVIGFGCNVEHRTSHNIAATGEFVVNIPDATKAPRIWDMTEVAGADRIARSRFGFRPSSVVAPPSLDDVVAHFECRHLQTVAFDGGEVFIFGTIVAASIDAACLAADSTVAYHRIDPVFFLENGLFAPLGRPAAARSRAG